LFPINGKSDLIDEEVKRIVGANWRDAKDADRDLFEYLIRHGSPNERERLSALASESKADLGWLDAIAAIVMERTRG
jgi:hypothetical protein